MDEPTPFRGGIRREKVRNKNKVFKIRRSIPPSYINKEKKRNSLLE